LSAGVPFVLMPTSLFWSMAITQGGLVLAEAIATERVRMVGADDMNMPENIIVTGWLIRTSAASVLLVWLPDVGGMLTVTVAPVPLENPKLAATLFACVFAASLVASIISAVAAVCAAASAAPCIERCV
jgi:hypothetical protein